MSLGQLEFVFLYTIFLTKTYLKLKINLAFFQQVHIHSYDVPANFINQCVYLRGAGGTSEEHFLIFGVNVLDGW